MYAKYSDTLLPRSTGKTYLQYALDSGRYQESTAPGIGSYLRNNGVTGFRGEIMPEFADDVPVIDSGYSLTPTDGFNSTIGSTASDASYSLNDFLRDIQSSLNQNQLDLRNSNNQAALDLWKLQRDWQTEMANTAHQREMADLRAAGINPILTAMSGGMGQGASTGGSTSNPTSYPAQSSEMADLIVAVISGVSKLFSVAFSK